MAFGRMTTKFRIMRGKMNCSLSMQSKVIKAVTRLHNFIIDIDGLSIAYQDIRLTEDGQIDDNELARLGIDRLPGDTSNHGFISVPYDTTEEGSSVRRSAIVEQLTLRTIERPISNIQRNRSVVI
jgi:hypothetical protein